MNALRMSDKTGLIKFKELRLNDRSLFEGYLGRGGYSLSVYHFCNIFIWQDIFRIFYTILDGCLCLFFQDSGGCFMYLPPLGERVSLCVIEDCFTIMDGYNPNRDISRIENVGERELRIYCAYGYNYSTKPGDYLYRREDIAYLKGNRFKSQRSSYNYFVRHYDFEFRPFTRGDIPGCLFLSQRWAEQRRKRFSDSIYQSMLQCSLSSQRIALENTEQLGLEGYVIAINGEIAAYTLGFALSTETFCILFEVCNLVYKGISQYIFSRFCEGLGGYRYINAMDDSGLENLRRVKMSYHPIRVVPNYIIRRDYA